MTYEELKLRGTLIQEFDAKDGFAYLYTIEHWACDGNLYVHEDHPNQLRYTGDTHTHVVAGLDDLDKCNFLYFQQFSLDCDGYIKFTDYAKEYRARLIPLTEYADLHGITADTAKQRAQRGAYKTTVKIGRQWFIDPNEPHVDNRSK